MNDQKIYEFIALKQSVRAVQIADRFDVSLAEASDALRSLVDVGDVLRTAGIAPNGQPAQFYSLAPSFIKSREGQLVIARIEADRAALKQAEDAPVSSSELTNVKAAPKADDSPAPSSGPMKDADHGANRSQIALDYIRKVGSVTDADLRIVMGLRAGQYPSAWLAAAVKRGEVNKDGKEWKVGAGSQIKRQPAFGGPLGLAGATPLPCAQENKPVQVPRFTDLRKQAAKPADINIGYSGAELATVIEKVNTALRPTSAFRVGIWSDGTMELQRNGVKVAELDQAERESVAAFMDILRNTELA